MIWRLMLSSQIIWTLVSDWTKKWHRSIIKAGLCLARSLSWSCRELATIAYRHTVYISSPRVLLFHLTYNYCFEGILCVKVSTSYNIKWKCCDGHFFKKATCWFLGCASPLGGVFPAGELFFILFRNYIPGLTWCWEGKVNL